MSANNPSITASDIIEDVENRLDDPGIDTTVYLPWVSYAYQKTYKALIKAGQKVKEALFEDNATINLTTNTLEITVTDQIPRFGGLVKLEVKYGLSTDEWNSAKPLGSSANWKNLHNVSTTYRSKTEPLYNLSGTKLMVIPAPPEDGATAYVRYIKRPYQITAGSDVIDIPYRFLDPLVNYVQARATERDNEDYQVGRQIDAKFFGELDALMEEAASEFNEHDGTENIQVSTNSPLFDDPLGY